jgi:hypothetical protein
MQKENTHQTGLSLLIKFPHPSLSIIRVITAHFRKLQNTGKNEDKKIPIILASRYNGC